MSTGKGLQSLAVLILLGYVQRRLRLHQDSVRYLFGLSTTERLDATGGHFSELIL